MEQKTTHNIVEIMDEIDDAATQAPMEERQNSYEAR